MIWDECFCSGERTMNKHGDEISGNHQLHNNVTFLEEWKKKWLRENMWKLRITGTKMVEFIKAVP